MDGVSVEADGSFDEEWCSTGIGYSVTIDARASTEDLNGLRVVVDEGCGDPEGGPAGPRVKPRA